jgi:hypothetical protein
MTHESNSAFFISNFRRVANAVCFLLGNSLASEFYIPTLPKTYSNSAFSNPFHRTPPPTHYSSSPSAQALYIFGGSGSAFLRF